MSERTVPKISFWKYSVQYKICKYSTCKNFTRGIYYVVIISCPCFCYFEVAFSGSSNMLGTSSSNIDGFFSGFFFAFVVVFLIDFSSPNI